MTSDRDALLKAIAAHPHEDTPRLAYADWLDEHGDARDRERAEFIRCQVAADPDARARAEWLLASNREDWERYVRGTGRGVVEVNWDRGFPNGVRVSSLAHFLAAAEEIFVAEPLLAALDLKARHIDADGARAIASAPALQNLRSLDLSENSVGDGGAEAIARSATLKHLASLSLADNCLESDGARALARGRHWGYLTHLDLNNNGLIDTGVEALVSDDSRLNRLTSLDLRHNYIGDRGARAIAQSPAVESLTWLDLRGNPHIGGDGRRALAHSRRLAETARIALDGFLGTKAELRVRASTPSPGPGCAR